MRTDRKPGVSSLRLPRRFGAGGFYPEGKLHSLLAFLLLPISILSWLLLAVFVTILFMAIFGGK